MSANPKHHHGQVICERYLLQGVCGRGGGGVIYRAFDLHHQMQVALKLTHNQVSSTYTIPSKQLSDFYSATLKDPQTEKHVFSQSNHHLHPSSSPHTSTSSLPNKHLPKTSYSPPQEYLIARQIDHPQIIKYLDVHLHDQRTVMVMEYVDASSFASFLHPTQVSHLSKSLKLNWMRQICTIVSALHQHQIIHCDLKPQNFLCLPSHELKLIDFGIALPLPQPIHAHSMIRGTPFYMAPEQFDLQSPLSIQSDLYSVGLLILHLMCEQLSWAIQPTRSILQHRLNHPELYPLQLQELSIPFQNWFKHVLHINPFQRPKNANELWKQFKELDKKYPWFRDPLSPSSIPSILSPHSQSTQGQNILTSSFHSVTSTSTHPHSVQLITQPTPSTLEFQSYTHIDDSFKTHATLENTLKEYGVSDHLYDEVSILKLALVMDEGSVFVDEDGSEQEGNREIHSAESNLTSKQTDTIIKFEDLQKRSPDPTNSEM